MRRFLSLPAVLGLFLLAGGPLFAQQSASAHGARAEMQQSLTQRYTLTEIGPGLLGLRGGADSIRRAGSTVVVQREGLHAGAERRQAAVNLVREQGVEVIRRDGAVQVRVGERFYVHSIYVASDGVELGLASVQQQPSGGRLWALLVFSFPPEVLHSGDRATVFRRLDEWLAPDGVASIPAPPTPTPAPPPAADSAVVKLEPGMTPAEVQRLLGPPQREVSFGRRTWLSYPGFVVHFEGDALTTVDSAGKLARLRVRSEPEAAEIYLGEKLVGSTPSTFELPPGRYVLIFRLNGYTPARRELDLLPGGDVSLVVRLEK